MKLFVTAGLGGMSGAQPKAASIAGMVSISAEINPDAAYKRHQQGWVDQVFEQVDAAIDAAVDAQSKREATSIAFIGNIVNLWERLDERRIVVDLGSDQTSLHNPWSGGYYPQGYSFEESNALMVDDPEAFKTAVQSTLVKHAEVINRLHANGMYFFD